MSFNFPPAGVLLYSSEKNTIETFLPIKPFVLSLFILCIPKILLFWGLIRFFFCQHFCFISFIYKFLSVSRFLVVQRGGNSMTSLNRQKVIKSHLKNLDFLWKLIENLKASLKSFQNALCFF